MLEQASTSSRKANKYTKLYAFGSNGHGQLGLQHREDTAVPQLSLFSTSKRKLKAASKCVIDVKEPFEQQREQSKSYLADDTIVKIVAGGNHTLLLTSEGRVWQAGGSNGDETGFREWELGSQQRVTDIATTWEASFVVVDSHEIHVCGSGTKGELGLGRDLTRTNTAEKEDELVKVMDLWDLDGSQNVSVKEIAAGMSHIVVVSSNGNVYGWGSCRKGQLGDDLKGENMLWAPKRMTMAFEVIKAVAGRDFTFLVGHDKDRILLGDQRYLSISDVNNAMKPTTQLSCGWSNIYALSDGHLQGFGRNDRGQLPPADLASIKAVAAGSEHCLAYTADKKVLAWGWGEHGNCGLPVDERGNVAGRWNEIPINLDSGDDIKGISAGCATSFIFTVYESR